MLQAVHCGQSNWDTEARYVGGGVTCRTLYSQEIMPTECGGRELVYTGHCEEKIMRVGPLSIKSQTEDLSIPPFP